MSATDSKEMTLSQNNLEVISSPDTFITQAITNKAPYEVMQGLFELKIKYEENEAKKAFNVAMVRFQTIKPVLTKGSKVEFKTGKGTTAYKFCSLPDIEKALREPLDECGLCYRFETVHREGMDGQRCIVTHILGHSVYNEMFSESDQSGNKNNIQGLGSAASYLQRYTLTGSFGLTSADVDDDGVASGDMPYFKVLQHNEALRDNLQPVLALKEALADNDLESAAMYYMELGQEVTEALWIAPTKGGIFTTKEVKQIKSDESAAFRKVYAQENNND